MELVTVIIPTFNSEQFIVQAIDSVVAQSYQAIEIVVVDDGSTDGTVAAARERLQGCVARSQLLELGVNGGPSAARNAALRVANGSWVQFLDSDDVLMPRKIDRQMAIGAAAPPDVAAIYSPWGWGFLEAGEIEWHGPLREPFIAGKAPIMCLAGSCRPLLGACLIRRSALDRSGGFDEALRFWECEEACFKLATVGRFVAASSGEAEYLWRLHKKDLYIGGGDARYKSTDVALGWIRLAVRAAGRRSIGELGLSEPDKRLLLRECTTWGRVLYADNRAAFREYLGLARALDANIAPSYPRSISALSRWVGYEGAEAALMIARRPKVWARQALRGLNLKRSYTMIELR